MSTTPQPLNDLVGKIRTAHPGAYDDMDDATLTKSVLAKYPQYSDLAAPKIKPPENPIDKAEPDVAGLAYNIAAPVAKNAYQISAPGIASSLLKQKAPAFAAHLPDAMTENATPAKELPGQIMQNGALMLAGEPGAPGEAMPSTPRSGPGMVMRVSKVLANRIPGVKLGSDLLEAVKGPDKPPLALPPAPEPATLPAREPVMASSQRAPAPINVKPQAVGDLLNKSLGGEPLKPNVPLKDQMKAGPNGHTPVSGSSLVKSYKYDPAAREFTAFTNDGSGYIHGDVSPEQVQAFEKNPSKGKAWNELRANSTPVAKIVNGQRVATKPPMGLRSASPDDLTPEWSAELDRVKKKKAAH